MSFKIFFGRQTDKQQRFEKTKTFTYATFSERDLQTQTHRENPKRPGRHPPTNRDIRTDTIHAFFYKKPFYKKLVLEMAKS